MEEVKKEVKIKDRPYIDAVNCVGCSLCIENCPMDCLELSKPAYHGDTHTYAYAKDPRKCISCGICAKHCPIDVITMCKPGTIPEKLTKGTTKTMGKVYCRVFQAVMKVGNYFMGYRTPEYIEGAGCIKELPKQILAKGVKNVLLGGEGIFHTVVTGPGRVTLQTMSMNEFVRMIADRIPQNNS